MLFEPEAFDDLSVDLHTAHRTIEANRRIAWRRNGPKLSQELCLLMARKQTRHINEGNPVPKVYIFSGLRIGWNIPAFYRPHPTNTPPGIYKLRKTRNFERGDLLP